MTLTVENTSGPDTPAPPAPEPAARARPSAATLVVRIGRKLLGAAIVVWAAATITFLIQTLLPGDRATLLLNQQTGQVQERTPEELAPINAMFGFDDPLLI